MPNDKPKRTRNTKAPLGPGECVDRIIALRAERQARLDEVVRKFNAAEDAKEAALRERCGDGELLNAMLDAATDDAPRSY